MYIAQSKGERGRDRGFVVNHIEQGRDQKTITITPITGHYYIGVYTSPS